MECWALTRRGSPTGGSWRGPGPREDSGLTLHCDQGAAPAWAEDHPASPAPNPYPFCPLLLGSWHEGPEVLLGPRLLPYLVQVQLGVRELWALHSSPVSPRKCH